MSKAVAVIDDIKGEFTSHLSGELSEHAKGRVFAQAVLFLMRDDYDGQFIFEPWQVGKVMRLLAKSARIQASWKDIGHLENNLDELMPEMSGLIVQLIAYKAVIEEHSAWQHFEELLPDRFLKAVLQSFGPRQSYPPFFTHVDPHDSRATPTTDFARLLRVNGGQHD